MDQEILALADKLPSGLNDPEARKKLDQEMTELTIAVANGDKTGALLEAADVYYYVQKCLYGRHINEQGAALIVRTAIVSLTGFSVDTIRRAALIKYGLRAQPGNPKNDAAERAAVSHLLPPECLSERLFRPFVCYLVIYGVRAEVISNEDALFYTCEQFTALPDPGAFGWWSVIINGKLHTMRLSNVLSVERLEIKSPDDAPYGLCKRVYRDDADETGLPYMPAETGVTFLDAPDSLPF